MEFTKEQMSKALDEAYKKAGHNAYFANGFEAGVVFAEQQFKILNIPDVMPRISHFIDENGNNVDLNAAGVNAKLLRDGTFEYFISYGFAGRKELTPVYVA